VPVSNLRFKTCALLIVQNLFSLLFLYESEGKKNISENRRAYKTLHKNKRRAAAAVARLAQSHLISNQDEALDDLPLGATAVIESDSTSNQEIEQVVTEKETVIPVSALQFPVSALRGARAESYSSTLQYPAEILRGPKGFWFRFCSQL
jgi:hypothetical protein